MARFVTPRRFRDAVASRRPCPNGADDSAETAVSRWSLDDRMLSVTFGTEVAAELGFEETMVFELPADLATDVRRHLTEILIDVPEAAA